MSAASLQRYDALPYHSAPYAETHPRSLRTIAALHGLAAPPLATARVLELGCASGGNLIPIAEEAPGATFLGIDLSARHIEEARNRVGQLALANIEFRQQSLMDLDGGEGEFDYIIAHGLFSWAPEDARLRIVQLCGELLSPRGVAVISYNAYPGCHARDQVRAMMQYHTAGLDDPQQQIDEAKSMLQFMIEHGKKHSAHRAMLVETLDLLKATNNKSYFYHDFLEDHNQPFYFHQFEALLRRRQLQVLAETRLFRWQTFDLEPAAAAQFADLPYAEREQYLDFLRNTPFHSHAVCRADVPIDRAAIVHRLDDMHFQWKFESRELPTQPTPGETLVFRGKRMKYATASAVGQQALIALGSQPARCRSFSELLALCAPSSPAEPAEEASVRDELRAELYRAMGHDLLEVYCEPPSYQWSIPALPKVANNARLQAAHGSVVTNRCHRYVRFDDLGRYLLLYLDGRHDRDALCRRVEEGIADGRIQLATDDHGRPKLAPAGLPGLVDETLAAVSDSAMLIS